MSVAPAAKIAEIFGKMFAVIVVKWPSSQLGALTTMASPDDIEIREIARDEFRKDSRKVCCVCSPPPAPENLHPRGLRLRSSVITIPSLKPTAALAGSVCTPPRWHWYTCIASNTYKGIDRPPRDTPETTTSRSIGF